MIKAEASAASELLQDATKEEKLSLSDFPSQRNHNDRSLADILLFSGGAQARASLPAKPTPEEIVPQNESPSRQIGSQGILGLVPRISEETIQRVAEANDIVEVIGSYFPLKRAGTSWRALCPFHREKTPSFHVNPQRQSYHCFGCGAGGTVFRFVMDYEHLDFPSAVRRLAQRAGSSRRRRGREARRTIAVMRCANDCSHCTPRRPPGFTTTCLRRPARRKRENTSARETSPIEIAKSWLLGYAPDSRDALMDFLREKHFSSEEIAQSGLAAAKEDERESQAGVPSGRVFARFRGRVMFPIRNDYGEVIAFSGRVLDPEAKAAKYVNSPETPLFTKGRVLYGLDKSKRALIEANTAIVCEGQLDLISAFEAGVQNVIAPQGTAFTPEQARLLRRFVEAVILCFDSDQAGQEAVGRSLPALLECGLDVRVAFIARRRGSRFSHSRKGRRPLSGRSSMARRGFFDHALRALRADGSS